MVITRASHARGHEFGPRLEYVFVDDLLSPSYSAVAVVIRPVRPSFYCPLRKRWREELKFFLSGLGACGVRVV